LCKTCAAARVDGDGDARVAFSPQIVDQRLQHGQWQVVDAVKANVFQHRNGDAFA
jgi:hypothetical protein